MLLWKNGTQCRQKIKTNRGVIVSQIQQLHCIVLLDMTCYSHSASLYPDIQLQGLTLQQTDIPFKGEGVRRVDATETGVTW